MTSALLFSGLSTNPSTNSSTGRRPKLAELPDVHSIVQVKSTMGQGDFVLEYPKLHELAASAIPWFALSTIFWCA